MGIPAVTDTKYLRFSVAERCGYSAQHDSAEIILDANESPYPLPGPLKRELKYRLDSLDLNRYPDSESRTLRKAAGNYYGVSTDRIVAGNGSDELIGYTLLACVNPGDKILMTEPSFSMYRILGNQFHGDVQTVNLRSDWSLPDHVVDEARESKIVILGSPNNPTGNRFRDQRVLELVEETDALVVLDEAYAEFAGESLVDRVETYDSFVVLRTLSKAFGLAGARVGFLVGFPSLVDGINTVRLPYNLNTLSQVTGEIVLNNIGSVRDHWNTVVEERRQLFEFLDENSFRPFPSEANFVLFEPDDPVDLYNHLLRDGIRVRKFNDGPVEDKLRVTVGTPEQNRAIRISLEQY